MKRINAAAKMFHHEILEPSTGNVVGGTDDTVLK
jgi:hypothetical protein